jgi:phenylacetate-coenzyme A ligase PaaK-like adenylate-forming protein
MVSRPVAFDTRVADLERRRAIWERRHPAQQEADMQRRVERIVQYHLCDTRNGGYRLLLREAGLRVKDTEFNVWPRLPVVDKSFLLSCEYAARPAVDGPVLLTETSGSTSSAVAVPHTPRSIRLILGENFLRALLMSGLRLQDRCWGIEHRLYAGHLSGSHLSFDWLRSVAPGHVAVTETSVPIADHVSVLRQWQPDCVASSPGFLTRLAGAVDGVERGPRLVVYGGAALDPLAKQAIARVLRPDCVAGFYPTTDAGALGVSPDDSGIYRCFSETHLIEVVDEDGRNVAAGEYGDLLVTVLDNRAAPLIRYRVGDRVRYVGTQAGRVLVSDIRRRGEGLLGASLLPFADLETWAPRLRRIDGSVVAVQLIRRRDERGGDVPVVRVVTATPTRRLRDSAARLLADFPTVVHEIAAGEVGAPVVELVAPERALNGQWKLPVYVDETRIARSGPTKRVRCER